MISIQLSHCERDELCISKGLIINVCQTFHLMAVQNQKCMRNLFTAIADAGFFSQSQGSWNTVAPVIFDNGDRGEEDDPLLDNKGLHIIGMTSSGSRTG